MHLGFSKRRIWEKDENRSHTDNRNVTKQHVMAQRGIRLGHQGPMCHNKVFTFILHGVSITVTRPHKGLTTTCLL